MGTRWDKMLADAGQVAKDVGTKVEAAVKHEAAVIEEHNVKTPEKVVEAVKHEAEVVIEHNKKGALDILKAAEAEAVSVEHSVANKIEEHAKGIEGALKHVLVGLAAKIRAGEEAITEELKTELAKVGIHL